MTKLHVIVHQSKAKATKMYYNIICFSDTTWKIKTVHGFRFQLFYALHYITTLLNKLKSCQTIQKTVFTQSIY